MLDKTPVSIGLKSSVSVPQLIMLPMALHSRLGISRQFSITSRTQVVPQAVVDWMRTDKRWADWFEPVAEPKAAKAVAPTKPESTSGVPMWKTSMTVADLRTYAKECNVALERSDNRDSILLKLRTAGMPMEINADTETWNGEMVVDDLRAYAARHGVALEGDDNKPDIVRKLGDAGLPVVVAAQT